MIIVITGLSCTGKTTIARSLAAQKGWILRSCGQALKEAANDIGIDLSIVPMKVHNQIDSDTIEFIEYINGVRVVEGRYLDMVLASVKIPLLIFKLIANNEVRQRRWTSHASGIVTCSIIEVDDSDIKFMDNAYPETIPLEANVVIDTSELSIEDCVDQISKYIVSSRPSFEN